MALAINQCEESGAVISVAQGLKGHGESGNRDMVMSICDVQKMDYDGKDHDKSKNRQYRGN
jgi:hypothetical protein